MNATNFELKFNARRPFAATKRKGYYVLGLIEMLVGSVGVFMIEYPLSRFYMILFIGGVFSFLAAAYGKNLIREANTIVINPQNIVFKNVSQRAKKTRSRRSLRYRTRKRSGRIYHEGTKISDVRFLYLY